jgi:hypothetical protein
MKIYCLCIKNVNFSFLKKLKLIPVGLGSEIFDKRWLNDKNKKNISKKNKYYGEYTFHYNLWKNTKVKNYYKKWIGFCTYRRFWVKKNFNNIINYQKLKKNIIYSAPKEWDKYESILVKPLNVGKIKKIKMIKNAIIEIIKSPSLFFNYKPSLKNHFTIFHGGYYLNEAIKLLNVNDRIDFINFLEKDQFNPFNMFICKNQLILNKYYESVFPWLEDCEKKFGFKSLKGYKTTRIYGYLAERYASFWFNKYTKSMSWPINFFDTSKKF